ncbi:universal stress protein [Halomonas sp. TG39a]|jgi:nucleotide-binding universal stress UspA family protein|uniref:universal stress protein n=1 Tax=Halomonas sp. TG39a TaxID=1415755 RepID=UPI00054F768E|nr:universal stress protein [Halomonas sp. TG39a]TDV96909.1 nucleotide-binding universal stress UspA family protein [Halomonas alkaliantarctica]
MYKRILVPIDGSENAKQALSVACKLLNKEASTLYLLHVPETLAYTTTLVWGIGAIDASANLAEREKSGEQLLVQAVSSAQEEGVQHTEELLTQGDPVRVILDTANAYNVDTIVMGSRGLSDLAGVVIGSVSHKVSHSAKCRVITVS